MTAPGRTFHSIHIVRDKCIGCVHCMQACPTRAIRVVDGKARIIDSLCIDCAECLRVCPYGAIHSRTTSFDALEAFDYKVAIPSTVVYCQFGPPATPHEILSALRRAGFDEAYDVSAVSELNTAATGEYLNEHPRPRPFITSTCPVVVRLIQRRYPALCGQILPIEPPREIAAKILRTRLPESLGLPSGRIGIVHITPCPAKMVSINSPASLARSYLDGAISVRDIFPQVRQALRQGGEDAPAGHFFSTALFSGVGMGWPLSGGEARGLKNHRAVAVSGIRDTMRVLDEVEAGLLQDIDLLECMVCPDGCVGGPLAVENRFLAKSRILKLLADTGDQAVVDQEDALRLYHRDFLSFGHPVEPAEPRPLDPDPVRAIRKARLREAMFARLPRRDCGVCGAPDCRTLADDIARGLARLEDCPFVAPAEAAAPPAGAAPARKPKEKKEEKR
ncbi:MAG TPA: [Fe-Fe] hydrogenase large subunit C-terminal domain-containing protein [Candidatus Aminicenantes bacterium]|nr:[Fe-Fe] hydrogenase large subunit C-terminal domain-containing protein [Candidatus Aminicenantes bacterium]